MRARRLIVPAITAAFLATPAGPAGAKLPPWTCELSTTQPVVGEPVRIEVRFWEDAAHTRPSSRVRVANLPFFIEAVADIPGGRGHAQRHATIRRVARGVYEGSLSLPDARRWRILPCGSRYDDAGYRTDAVVVGPRPLSGRGPTTPWIGSQGVGSSAAAVLALVGPAVSAFLAAIVHRRSPRVNGIGTAG